MRIQSNQKRKNCVEVTTLERSPLFMSARPQPRLLLENIAIWQPLPDRSSLKYYFNSLEWEKPSKSIFTNIMISFWGSSKQGWKKSSTLPSFLKNNYLTLYSLFKSRLSLKALFCKPSALMPLRCTSCKRESLKWVRCLKDKILLLNGYSEVVASTTGRSLWRKALPFS